MDVNELHSSWQVDFRHYHRLGFEDLSAQLQPFLIDQSHSFGARLTAIRLAQACGQEDLVGELTQLAVDAGEDPSLRVAAISAVGVLGGAGDSSGLRPLLSSPVEKDTDHKIVAAVLEALWPTKVSTDEMLFQLTLAEEVATPSPSSRRAKYAQRKLYFDSAKSMGTRLSG
jgi:hypothetical protein